MADIIMPKMGDAMDEGKIVQWLKSVGDSVKEGDAIAEIETDKSNVEVEATASGILQQITVPAGQSAPVGGVIAIVGSGAVAQPATTPATPAPTTAPAPASAVAPQPEPAPAQHQPAMATATPVVERESSTVPAYALATAPTAFKPYDSFVGGLPEGLGGSASLVGEPIAVTGGDNSSDRVRISPLARAIAQTHNLNLSAVRGSAPDGGIVARDVEAALSTGTVPAPAPASITAPATPATPATSVTVTVNAGDEVQEYNAMRRTIAKRLTESKATIPHFYVTSEIDVEALMTLREQINTGASEGQAKISFSDFLIKACAAALVKVPVVNSAFSDNKRILRKAVNIGTAVSIDDGLIVPVVRDCQSKSLRAIANEMRPLIEKARGGKLKPEEYTGGTFTISNLGQYDVENFAAIINPGEAAILAVSSIRQVPAVVNDAIVPRRRMKVTLCADHRVMDGVAGAQFLQELKRLMEEPLGILV